MGSESSPPSGQMRRSLPRPTAVRFEMLTWLTLAAALAYLCRGPIGVAESTIRGEFGLSFQKSGGLMSLFFLSYSVFQIPGGLIGHRWGTRIALATFAVAWSLASALAGMATGVWMLFGALILMGVAQAGIFPVSTNSISHWIPLARRSFSCGILAMGMQIGAIAASALAGMLLAPVGWRWVFLIFAAPGIVWTIFFVARFRDSPQAARRVNVAELSLIRAGKDERPSKAGPEPVPWRAAAGNPALWLLCGQQICRASGYMFFATWFPTFLQETRGVSIANSGLFQALIFGATLAGSLGGGALTDYIWKRTGSLRASRSGIGATCLGLTGLLIFGAFVVTSLPAAMALLTAAAFLAALAGPCAFAATIDISGRHVPPFFAVMNMSGNFAAAATPVAVGALFAWTANWNLVLVVFAGIYLLGALSWVFVDPARKIQTV